MFYIRWFGVFAGVLFGACFQKPYSKAWDKKLRELIESDAEITDIRDHSLKIGGYQVWTSNRWYSYATPYGASIPERRPSISTMILFNDYVERKCFR